MVLKNSKEMAKLAIAGLEEKKQTISKFLIFQMYPYLQTTLLLHLAATEIRCRPWQMK